MQTDGGLRKTSRLNGGHKYRYILQRIGHGLYPLRHQLWENLSPLATRRQR